MKASSNQIYMAASNILNGLIAIQKECTDETIRLSVELAERLSEKIIDDNEGLLSNNKVFEIVAGVFEEIKTNNSPSSLLTSTIMEKYGVKNKNLQTAILQKAESLGIVKKVTKGKSIIYILQK